MMEHTFESETLTQTKLILIIASSALFASLFIFLALQYFLPSEAFLRSFVGFLIIYLLFFVLSTGFFILDHHNYKDLSVKMDNDEIHFLKPDQKTVSFNILNVKKYSAIRTFYGWFGYLKFNFHITNKDKTYTQGILIKKETEYDMIEALKTHKKAQIKKHRG